MANKAVYTALIGNYDELKEPSIVSNGWDYICFTDQDIKSDVWQIRKVKVDGDPQRLARRIKISFDKYIEHRYSLWIDASFEIKVDLNDFWGRFFISPFAVPKHPVRDCVYREIESCIANFRGDEQQLREQAQEYKRLGMPAFNGIITSGVMMRERTDFMIAFCEKWHDELDRHSVRDQVAFAKVAWSINWKYHRYIWNYTRSSELIYHKHFKYR